MLYFSPWDSFTSLLEEYIAYIWLLTYRDTVGIARLVIFSVQTHDVFWVKDFFFSHGHVVFFGQFWKSWQPKDVRMMWWDRLFEAKNKLWAVGWIGPGWARHG